MGLSHAVGDGHTYHKVLRLLFSDDPIESLIVDRITTTYQQQEDFIGPDYRITSSWSFLRVAIWGEMRRALLGYTTAPVFQLIDSNKVGKLKKESLTPDVDFVSTNDVLSLDLVVLYTISY